MDNLWLALWTMSGYGCYNPLAGAIRWTESCMSTSHPLWGMNRNDILSNVPNKLGLVLPKGNQPINHLMVVMNLGIRHFWDAEE